MRNTPSATGGARFAPFARCSPSGSLVLDAVEVVRADTEGIARGAEVLRAGGIVAYPTETVYGLGCNPFDEEALDRLYDVKGRPAEFPLLLIAGSLEHALAVASFESPAARQCAQQFWPGPLSLLLDANVAIPARLLGPSGKVCLRLTSHPVAQGLCAGFGACVTSTSANRSGEPPALAGESVALKGVDLLIDGGVLPPGPVSTVYDPDGRVIVREGAVPKAALDGLP